MRKTSRVSSTECVTGLDYQSKMIIFGLILTTFDLAVFCETGAILKIEPPSRNLAFPNLCNAL